MEDIDKDTKIAGLRSEIEKHQKHYKIPTSVIYGVLGIVIAFLIGLWIYFSTNSNQIKLTITNGSEMIKRLEVRAENAENAQVQERDRINILNNDLVSKDSVIKTLKDSENTKDQKIKQLNETVDSLRRIVNTYKHSDIEPVKK